MSRHVVLARRCGRLAVATAVLAMGALHLVQPATHPLHEPVSFYIHGTGGVWLPVSLGAFGLAGLSLAVVARGRGAAADSRWLAACGVCLLVTSVVPSDCWFPWEAEPSVHGLVHGAAAVLGPALLVIPLLRSRQRLLTAIYGLGLVASAVSLAVGFWRDEPPPWIGLAERILGVAAVLWLWVEFAAKAAEKRATKPRG